MSGYVYYITTGEAQRFKIGYTKNRPEQRLKELQTGSPFELCILAIERGGPDLEKKLHAIFAAHRLHGEWFERCEALVERMKQANRNTVAEAKAKQRTPPRWARIWAAFDAGATPEEAELA